MNAYPPTRIVVIGLGYEDRGDDAIGPTVARQLAGQTGIRTVEVNGEGASLIRGWQEADVVILIDALQCGGLPGAILRLDSHGGKLPGRLLDYSRHASKLADAADIARLNGRIPSRMIVFGVEGANFADGEPLSSDVAKAAVKVVGRARREIRLIKRHLLRECALIKDLLQTVNMVAEEQRPARVVGITVCLRAQSHISPAHFREHFNDAVRGTHLDGVHLDLEQLPDASGTAAEDIVLDTVELEE